MVGRLKDWNDLEGSGHGQIELISQTFISRDWEKPRKSSVRISDIPANEPNTTQIEV
jgi:hypothetical protein